MYCCHFKFDFLVKKGINEAPNVEIMKLEKMYTKLLNFYVTNQLTRCHPRLQLEYIISIILFSKMCQMIQNNNKKISFVTSITLIDLYSYTRVFTNEGLSRSVCVS